jgi:hypothetical protein
MFSAKASNRAHNAHTVGVHIFSRPNPYGSDCQPANSPVPPVFAKIF